MAVLHRLQELAAGVVAAGICYGLLRLAHELG